LTFELACKVLKEILELHGVAEAVTGSPREIFKSAYKLGWLSDDKIWLDMLKKRNIAIHTHLCINTAEQLAFLDAWIMS